MSRSNERRALGAARRIVTVLVVPVLALGLMAPPAQAHAVLDHADPASGSALAEAPAVVDLWFSEDVVPDLSEAHLVDAGGQTVQGSALSGDPADARHLVVELPPLDAGSYGILWRVLAQDDAHTTTGVVVFSVGTGAAPSNDFRAPSATSAASSAVRFLRISALAFLVGGLAMVVFVLGRVRRRVAPSGPVVALARRRILLVMLVAAGTGVLVGVATLLVTVDDVPGATVGTLLGSGLWGTLWVVGEAVLLGLAAVTFAMRRRVRDDAPDLGDGLQAGAVALVLAMVAIEALESHAAALPSPAALLAEAVHVLAALLWLGLLASLVMVLWTLRGVPARAEVLRALRSPFSWLAFTSVVLIVATGLVGAGAEVRTPADLAGSSYGRLLLLKAALLMVAGGIAAVNAARLHEWRSARNVPRRRPVTMRLVVIEAAMGVAVLVAAAVLADTPPANTPPAAAAGPQTTRNVFGSVQDLVVSLAITPDRPGVNGFTVVAASSQRPAPAPIDGVALRMAPATDGATPTVLRLQPTAENTYFGSATISQIGAWRATVDIARSGERLTVPMRWAVAPTVVTPPPVDRDRHLAPIANALAAAILLIAAMAIGLALLRRRSGGHEAPPDGPDTQSDRSPQPDEERVPEAVP